MPELPDVVVYVESLARRFTGRTLERIRLRSPFLLRSIAPPLETLHGSLHVVSGEDGLEPFRRGGIEVLETGPEMFLQVLRRENHTLKRALTDPRLFSGIGNAYSDEILHRARLSPMRLTARLDDEEARRLRDACIAVLLLWTERLRRETGDGFPVKATAFRTGMAVHGRYGQACPACAAPVQRIVYADNECNYCPRCQTEGRLLADRALSRLLKDDWPKNLDELEELSARHGAGPRNLGGPASGSEH